MTVIIDKVPPLQLAPNFTKPLEDYQFNLADELSFTLPATSSAGGYAVRASLTDGPKWLSFDPKTLKFTVKAGST